MVHVYISGKGRLFSFLNFIGQFQKNLSERPQWWKKFGKDEQMTVSSTKPVLKSTIAEICVNREAFVTVVFRKKI